MTNSAQWGRVGENYCGSENPLRVGGGWDLPIANKIGCIKQLANGVHRVKNNLILFC